MEKNIVRHGSLFSGMGGFDLAASWMGWENVFNCEISPFCRKILNYYFSNSAGHEDIRKTDFRKYKGKIDILTGGFPCQPYSVAGKRLGKNDERHLWPEMFRAVQQIRPNWVVAENVLGIVSWNEGLVFEEVCADMEAEGYWVQPYVLPAAAVDAPHRRDRVWFVAQRNEMDTDSHVSRLQKKRPEQQTKGTKQPGKLDFNVAITNADSRLRRKERLHPKRSKKTAGNPGQRRSWNYRDPWKDFPSESPICIGNDGFPTLVDTITFSKWRQESIKAAGNAIVPQIAYRIFQIIQLFIDQDKKMKR